MRIAVALPALLMLLAGCAGGPSLDVEESKALAAAAAVEVNLTLEKGDRIEYTWTADAPLAFDIHTHGAAGVEFFVQEQTASMTAKFEAPADGDYSLMWENKATRAVQLDYKVTGAGKLA